MSIRSVGYTAWTGASPSAEIELIVKVGGERIANDIPLIVLKYPAYFEQVVDLASGLNTITVPYAKCTQCIVIVPEGETDTITIKGVTGDTGVMQLAGGVFWISLPTTSPPANIALTASGTIAATRFVWL